jgi:phosphopantothenoylcysteine decarboxylase/phosphopantothenate--cysteine ligase
LKRTRTSSWRSRSAAAICIARDKFERKGLDLIVANDITAPDAGFDVDTNRVVILDARGDEQTLELASTSKISEYLIRRIAQMLAGDR